MKRTEMLQGLKEGKSPLALSIQKWQDIMDGTGENNGIMNCALCEVYVKPHCKGCPVSEKTGYAYCERSPMEKIEELSDDKVAHPPKELAQKELEFLMTLRS